MKKITVNSTKKHFVTFLSPGTMFSEQSTRPIRGWSTKLAVELSKDIVERYGATPYGFYFETRRMVVPKIVDQDGVEFEVEAVDEEKSAVHYLHGKIFTFDQIVARNGDNDILISNMRSARNSHIIEHTKGYRSVHEFNEEHVLVDDSGNIIRTGKDDDIAKDRARITAAHEKYWKDLQDQWEAERNKRAKSA